MKTARFFSIVLLLVLLVGTYSLVAAKVAANPPEPSYIEGGDTPATVVDGNPSEWVSEDFFANLHKAGKADKEVLATVSLRYDCATEILFANVVPTGTLKINTSPDNNFIKLGNSNKLVDGSDSPADGTPPDFEWANKVDSTSEGWEASVELAPGIYSNFNVHALIGAAADTAQVIDQSIILKLVCEGKTQDWGDLPDETDIYSGLTLDPTGASHIVSSLFLGPSVNTEGDGQPNATAEGDQFDDGVVPLGNWQTGVGQGLQVTVTGGDGCLFGWLDYKDGPDGYNGSFEEDETLLYNYPVTEGPNTIDKANFINVPDVGDNSLTFARFRLLPEIGEGCSYGDISPGAVNATLDMLTGAYEGGEVEDYHWIFGPNAVSMAGFSASAEGVPSIWIAVVALLSVSGITVFAWMRRRTG